MNTSPFVFLAGDVALDLVNTVLVARGAVVDRISTPAELRSWIAASPWGSEFGVPGAIPRALHVRVVRLRDSLASAFTAVIAGEDVPVDALAVVNAALREGPGSELVRAPDGLRRRVAIDLEHDATALPWLVADAGARLLTGDTAGRLRRCANHDTCVLLFLDTSRNRSRRWCSMEGCGNRSKVAAHSARRRASMN